MRRISGAVKKEWILGAGENADVVEIIASVRDGRAGINLHSVPDN